MANACGLEAHRKRLEKEENKKLYTDSLAAYFAKLVGAKPRGKETVSEQDERGAFVRQPNYFIKPIT
jgi:putative glutathione S-transferase